ncbi:hypothetical protein Pfo_010135 [Paulownia fortunei]|nr:hypothetical protein Pfo_010135 [Paulownia fortunei]
MALPMVALAKLSLIAAAHHGVTPLVTALLWPFVLKFSFSFRPLHEGCTDMMHALRLFFFQMGQIATNREPSSGGAGGVRWQRALRLVFERVIHARRAQSTADGEDSLLILCGLQLLLKLCIGWSGRQCIRNSIPERFRPISKPTHVPRTCTEDLITYSICNLYVI